MPDQTPTAGTENQRQWPTLHDWVRAEYHPGIRSGTIRVHEWYQGRYQIEEFLGAGHTSVVFKAVDTTLDRLAAVKLWQTRDDQINPAILLREAKLLAKIDHLNVVKVFDYGLDSTSNEPWMSLEYLGRRTLRTVADTSDGAMPSPLAVAHWGIQLCGIVDYLHNSAELFQLDLKPDNVALRKEADLVTLMDLGSAADDRDRFDRFGTPGHIAPELLESDYVVQKCDIFSLGVLLYEVLSGQNPFMKLQEAVVHRRGQWADYTTAALHIEPRHRQKTIFSAAAKAFNPAHSAREKSDAHDGVYRLLKLMCSESSEERPTANEARLELERLAGTNGPGSHISIFISHAHLDKERFARHFAEALRVKGFHIWLDEWSLKTGEPFWERIGQAIQSCDFIVVVLSKNSIKSQGVLEELRTAQLFNLEKVKVLPIRIDPIRFSEIPAHLRARHVLDFVGWEDGNVFDARVSKLSLDIRSLRDQEVLTSRA